MCIFNSFYISIFDIFIDVHNPPHPFCLPPPRPSPPFPVSLTTSILLPFLVLYTCSIVTVLLKFISFLSSGQIYEHYFQAAGATFAVCFSMHAFIICLLNGFSHTPLCHFHSLCVLVPSASILLVLYNLSLYG